MNVKKNGLGMVFSDQWSIFDDQRRGFGWFSYGPGFGGVMPPTTGLLATSRPSGETLMFVIDNARPAANNTRLFDLRTR